MDSTPKSGEFHGKSLEAAIATGLDALGLSRDEVEVEVVHPGSRGVLGIGAEDARVRLIQKQEVPSPPPPVPEPRQVPPQPEPAAREPVEVTVDDVEGDEDVAATSRRLLLELLQRMGLQADVETRWEGEADQPDRPPVLILDTIGKDLGVLIGRRGETLAALQYILRLMVSQATGQWQDLVVDVEQYKVRRERSLQQLALRMAEQARSSGRTVRMEPMPPAERRIIHITLRDVPDVTTVSEGEEDRRKVTIVPKKGGEL